MGFEQYLWKICEHTIEKYVDTVLDGRKINDTDEMVIRQYFGCVLFGVVPGWLDKGHFIVCIQDKRTVL